MIYQQVSQIDGVQVFNFESTLDSRGVFLKCNPSQGFIGSVNSMALSFNPKIGTLRGLHFQVEPFAEEKLVACVQGAILDVIVDLRPSSNTIGKWMAFEMTAENAQQLYLPKGVAHGFQTLQPDSIVCYSLGASYAPEHSYSINPLINLPIKWPISDITISEKDASGITLPIAIQKYAESDTR
jgi:dTDP-4-dehydrorhamnose 3,5-epimerase